MECRLGVPVSHDTSRQFVSSLANRAVEAVWGKCEMVEQRLAQL